MDHIFDETQPIYYQIVQRICARILRGEYKPGDKLPSVIDAAMHFKVNHNTIQRVYQELIRQGIATAKRGEGTFVTEDRRVLDRLHADMRQSLLENFFIEMRRLGYSSDEILASLQQYIQAEKR
ncbi:MAG TPA: GntR family transcriptional regulator [Anaerolineaceae bacterium]|nr:GntR family transcriptional regulator [Anaerolineaceae bacterium]